MIVAIVPLAFYTQEHVDMTARFLDRLHDEVDRIGVWFNGGPLEEEGRKLLSIWSDKVEVYEAVGWNFYRMWNDGARWAQEMLAPVALYLNNDITWPKGALKVLAQTLDEAEADVACASPSPGSDFLPDGYTDIIAAPAFRGLLGWCFAIRPWMWQPVDERYVSWYGDDELAFLIHEAGWRAVRAIGVPVEHPPGGETTFQHYPEIWARRAEDEQLYREKWGDHWPQVAVNVGVDVALD